MCCCLTDAAKLAWATKNHVTPPASFLKKLSKNHPAKLEAESSDIRLQVKLSFSAAAKFETCLSATTSSATTQAPLSKCCQAGAEVKNGISGYASATDKSGAVDEDILGEAELAARKSRNLPPRGVTWIDAMSCSGEGTFWTLITQVIPPAPNLTRRISDAPSEFVPLPADIKLDSPSYSPPEPPPRAV